MGKYKLTPKAKLDIRSILHYTTKKWNKAQARKYIQELDIKLQLLADNPNLGRERNDIADNYYSFVSASHVIFYLIDEQGIIVIGIPHQTMDAVRHLEDKNIF